MKKKTIKRKKSKVNRPLLKYHELHRGKTGIIYACGPTLNQFDISRLDLDVDKTIHIAMKLAILSKNVPKIDYYFFGDDNSKSKLYEHMLADLGCEKFGLVYLGKEHNYLCYTPDFCNQVGAIPVSISCKVGFQANIAESPFYKSTTIFPCIQFALFLGLHKIYIVGLDATDDEAFMYVDHHRKANLMEKFDRHKQNFQKFKNKIFPHVKIIHINPVNLTDMFDESITI